MPTDNAVSRGAIRTHAGHVRIPLISQLDAALTALVTTPAVAVDDEARDAFRHALEAYESLARISTGSSDPRFALRDLPADERDQLASARHLLGVLDALHGPKAG